MATFRTGAATFAVQVLDDVEGTAEFEDVANAVHGSTYGGGTAIKLPYEMLDFFNLQEFTYRYDTGALATPDPIATLSDSVDVEMNTQVYPFLDIQVWMS